MKISSSAVTTTLLLSGTSTTTPTTAFQPTKLISVGNVGLGAESDQSTKAATGPLFTEKHAVTESIYPKTNSAFARYKAEHKASLDDPKTFWHDKAMELIHWEHPFDVVLQGSLKNGNIRWFSGGTLNICYNAVDRHVDAGHGERLAVVWEGDEPTDIRRFTYCELQRRVCQIANALKQQGVMQGDVVTIYMPMIPELLMTMLAVTRLGAVHSVVFAGFSADALAQRIDASNSKFLITADQGMRAGKPIGLKSIVDEARTKYRVEELLNKVFVWERFYDEKYDSNLEEIKEGDHHIPPVPYKMLNKDMRMNVLTAGQRPYCPIVPVDSEDNLFILYTSGSTGQPKGVVHTAGGYAVYAAFTSKTTFDLIPGQDLFACVADCGWITGHTYVVYGPLLNGATTFMFESTPVYPDAGRYWSMIERHQITQFYTAPTAIRALMQYDHNIPLQYNLTSLRILGSVGEPINPAAWDWYYKFVGREQCTVVDTYWQTETGGHLITNLPGVTPMKPGSCTLPMYGIDPVVLDAVTGKEIHGEPGQIIEGVLAIRSPWPGMARSCLNDHARFELNYLKPYPGYYFTGDSVFRDKDGYYFITGRVDDVLNVSGHRIGTAEVESALVAHPAVAQAAVVGKPHPIKGEAIVGFVMLDYDHVETPELVAALRNQVRKDIGPFASPDVLWIVPNLPMTRSGKIMRRILRKIVAGEMDTIGDVSTLSDPTIVATLIDKVHPKEVTAPKEDAVVAA